MSSFPTKSLLTLAAAALLAACSSASAPQSASPAVGSKGTTGACAKASSQLALAGTVYYDPQIKVMMNTYCAGCHSGRNSPDLTSYSAVKAAAQQSLSDMQSGDMPRGQSMSQSEIATFQAWIQGGMPNVTPSSGATSGPVILPTSLDTGTDTGEATDAGGQTTLAPTYYADVQPILAKACVSCHGKGGQAPDYSTYTAAKTNVGAGLTAIEGLSMPPSGSVPLASGALAKLEAWQQGGFLQGKPSSTSSKSGSSNGNDGCD